MCSESSKGKMNLCYISRISERRRNVLKCCEMFCDDTLEERAMNRPVGRGGAMGAPAPPRRLLRSTFLLKK